MSLSHVSSIRSCTNIIFVVFNEYLYFVTENNSRWVKEIIWYRMLISINTGNNMFEPGSTNQPESREDVRIVSKKRKLCSHVQRLVHFVRLLDVRQFVTIRKCALDEVSPLKNWKWVVVFCQNEFIKLKKRGKRCFCLIENWSSVPSVHVCCWYKSWG